MAKKILVAYATRYGSTLEVAEKISEKLQELGHVCDCMDFQDVEDITKYDGLIAGSAIHMGKWLPEAKEFMEGKRAFLSTIPVVLFSLGITLTNPTDHVTRKALFATDEICQYVTPKEIKLFAGRLIRDELIDADRDLVILAKPPFGDFRDYRELEKWTTEIESKYFRD